MNLRSRVEKLENRGCVEPLRISRHFFAPSPTGPELVGIHRDGQSFDRLPGETVEAFLSRVGEA
jgi:hypothetical protein